MGMYLDWGADLVLLELGLTEEKNSCMREKQRGFLFLVPKAKEFGNKKHFLREFLELTCVFQMFP